MTELRRICVICGSNPGQNPRYAEAARDLGTTLARQGIGLVYGGANVGLMGEVANAALSAGGEVIGVIPRAIHDRVGHGGLTRLEVVDSPHQRKQRFSDLSDAYIALPGGLGTFEELFEVATWGQLGIHHRPCGVLDVDGFYSGLFAFLEHAVAEQFVQPAHLHMIARGASPLELFDAFRKYEHPRIEKWIRRKE